MLVSVGYPLSGTLTFLRLLKECVKDKMRRTIENHNS